MYRYIFRPAPIGKMIMNINSQEPDPIHNKIISIRKVAREAAKKVPPPVARPLRGGGGEG